MRQRDLSPNRELEEMNATFEVRTLSDHLTILFSSAMEQVDSVSRETENFLSQLGIQEKAFRILLSMREALTNAIRHGNQEDPQKMIRYRVHLDEGDLVMEVEDEGAGFDWKNHIKRKPRVRSESGRGLFIMRQYASEVWFNDRGNRLVLRFK
ncbi:MAG: ATP-binding protein [Deltaproteobacteria bacterium]|nr:ATP-binding protein [Deltaproteobacteria bacterium]